MTKTPRIRACADADWTRTLGLVRAVFLGEGFGNAERMDRFCRREVLEPSGTMLVAVEHADGGERVLGSVLLAHTGGPMCVLAQPGGGGGEAEFRLLAVDPAARGRGVGEALVRECIRRAALPPWSAHTVVLDTQPTMHAAQRLYERLGFVRLPQRDKMLGPEAQGAGGPSTRERWAYGLRVKA